MSQQFDHFMLLDWSARNTPSPVRPSNNAIWLAEGSAKSLYESGRRRPVRSHYFQTRAQAEHAIQKRLLRLTRSGQRVLLGVDFSLAYPKGIAKGLNLKGPAWSAVWKETHRLVQDNPRNRNNRFWVAAEFNRRIGANLGPFWGSPKGQSGIFLGPRKDFRFPIHPRKKVKLQEYRLVESRHPRLQSTWKLRYAGSVGSQTLLGLPMLYRLRFEHPVLSGLTQVWPFESGWELPEHSQVVVAEIWPSLIERPRRDKIADREQLRTYLQWLRSLQAQSELRHLFEAPDWMTPKQKKRVLKHEGWILGVR